MGLRDTQITDEQVDDVINMAYEIKDEQGTKWPGMSYEDGVLAALRWVTGEEDENPFEEN